MFREAFRISGKAFAILALSLALGTSAFAASACKELPKSRCAAKAGCSWVNSYTTKTGTKVKGYCRAKPGKGTSSGSVGKTKKNVAKSREAKRKAASDFSDRKVTKKKTAEARKPAKVKPTKKNENKTVGERK